MPLAKLMRVLVVDDNPDMSSFVKIVLERAGFEAEVAADGQRALDLQREHPADVLITDIFMPEPDGLELIHMVPKGRVYGVDTEPDMVRYLAERAKREKRDNVVAVGGTPRDPRLPEKVDLILLVDVFHHIDDRERYFRNLRASLKPGGRVAVIDFRMDSPNGPPKAARIAPQRVIAELKAAGYGLAKQHDFLPNQYFLIFQPRG